jgi:hypothetical protein
MPRFFFHLRSPQKNLVDCEGMMLGDVQAARSEATKAVDDFFQPVIGRVQAEWEDWRFEVSDQRGRCVFALAFADAAAPRQDLMERPELFAPVVIDLDIARIRRELSSLEKQTRGLVRRASELVGRARLDAKTLSELCQQTQELRQVSMALLDLSRKQSSLGFMSFADDSRASGKSDLHS